MKIPAQLKAELLANPATKAEYDALGCESATAQNKGGKTKVTLRLDTDVLDAFKATGTGWQARINALLWEAVAIGRVKV
jgi:uncharacterized protein (DUF4415 family)